MVYNKMNDWKNMEIKSNIKEPRKSMTHKTTSGKALGKFAIVFHVNPSDFRFISWFISFLKFGLPRL